MRILLAASSSLKPRVNASMPPLEVAYGTTFFVVSYACTELIFTIALPFGMWGTEYLQKRNTERRLTLRTLSKSLVGQLNDRLERHHRGIIDNHVDLVPLVDGSFDRLP